MVEFGKQIGPSPRGEDLVIAKPISEIPSLQTSANDRLVFDGYKLYWQGAEPVSFDAFSGVADESAKELVKDVGPTPQGLFAIDPANIEKLQKSDDWGSHRVKIEPYQATVDRMKSCFDLIRTSMYIHGGDTKGTKGCIEINDNQQEISFFEKLAKYEKKIELEVKYVGEREKKYEADKCPY